MSPLAHLSPPDLAGAGTIEQTWWPQDWVLLNTEHQEPSLNLVSLPEAGAFLGAVGQGQGLSAGTGSSLEVINAESGPSCASYWPLWSFP